MRRALVAAAALLGALVVPSQAAALPSPVGTDISTVVGSARPALVWRSLSGEVVTRALSADRLSWAGPERVLAQRGERPSLVVAGDAAALVTTTGTPGTASRMVTYAPCTVVGRAVTGCAAATPWVRSSPGTIAPEGGRVHDDGSHLWLSYAASSCEGCAPTARTQPMCFSQGTARTAPASGRPRTADCLTDVPLAKDPVGWDALRRLDLLPRLPQGVAAKQFSSFARDGSNGDGSQAGVTCRRMIDGEGCVLAEADGAGEIDSIWMTDVGPAGNGDVSRLGTLTVTIDGQTVVSHSLQGVLDGELGAPFAYPLVANAAQTHSGGWIKVPMTYRTGMRVSLSGTSTGGYFHVTYKRYADAVGVPSFTTADTATDVLATLSAASSGTHDPKPTATTQTATSTFSLAPGASQQLASLTGGGTITQLRLAVPGATEAQLAALRLQISFDGTRTVDSPVGEFFGSGLGDTAVVRALMFSLRAPDGSSYAWWPMPFGSSASVSLVNTGTAAVSGDSGVTWSAGSTGGGHFHATSHQAMTDATRDWTFLETTGTGKVVGVNHTMHGDSCSGGVEYLEGDDRTYVDGSRTPQVIGTGTEDLYEGGWYFRVGGAFADTYSAFSTPFNGSPAQTAGTVTCGGGLSLNQTPYDVETTSTAAFRSLLTDAVPFSSSLRFTIMHGEFFGPNDYVSTYGSTTFWYGEDAVTSVQTDQLVVGDPASEQAHAYTCTAGCAAPSPARPVLAAVRGAGVPVVPPSAVAPLLGELSSGFESDDPNQFSQAVGAVASGSVSFTVAVDPAATGLTLRRLSDQYAAYQSVGVAVNGTPVGLWTQPLNNTTDAHRWLEDDFDIPGDVLGGSSVTVTLTQLGDVPWQAAEYAVLSQLPIA